MQATSTSSFSNFYIMEFLGLMAAIPRCTARPRRSPAGGRHGTVHLPGAHRSYWIYFMFTIVPKIDDAATIFYRITLHIPHDEAGAGP
jgi:hypothetical protein